MVENSRRKSRKSADRGQKFRKPKRRAANELTKETVSWPKPRKGQDGGTHRNSFNSCFQMKICHELFHCWKLVHFPGGEPVA